MNRDQVLERLEPVMRTQVRTLEHNPRTRIMVTPDMLTLFPGGGMRSMELAPAGVQSLFTLIGLPETMAGKLRPQTLSVVATELLRHRQRYSVVTKEGVITAVTRQQRFHQVNPERLIRTVESAIPGIDFHRVVVLDNLVASLEVVGDRRQAVRPGDLVQAGAQVTFSPIGTVNPLVQSYVLRLICTNGNTSNTVLREFSFGDGETSEGDNVWQWFRRSISQAYNAMDRIVHRYQEMVNEQVSPGDRATMLEAMLREAKIRGQDAEAVHALALQEPPENTYDLMNLLTYATSHILERPQMIREAQNVAADFSGQSEHARVCPVCHSRRN